MDDRDDRTYNTTKLPTLRDHSTTPADRELLIKLYQETCTTWRMLVDVRFKLFALVPTTSLISLATIFGSGDATRYLSPGLRLLFAGLGLSATLGLLIYELRNSQLHDDLISRARKIEDELGVDTGVFRGRTVAKGLIKHNNATFLIYGTAFTAWLTAIWTSICALLH